MSWLPAFHTRIDIPPGKGAVADRLKLDGDFHISSAHFTQLNIQSKVAELSRRGSGHGSEPGAGTVASDFTGKFVLGDGVMTFSSLTFQVPGASVHLDGTYALHSQAIAFEGSLRLQAKLSQLTTGRKSALLKLFDPLLEKEGAGTFVPIKITGTVSDPHFAVEYKRIL